MGTRCGTADEYVSIEPRPGMTGGRDDTSVGPALMSSPPNAWMDGGRAPLKMSGSLGGDLCASR